MLKPEVHEDRYLLRFLRARKWSVDKANDMFRDTLQFRAKWHLDTILKDYKPPQVRARTPCAHEFERWLSARGRARGAAG